MSISDPSHISCVANDFGYDHIFSRYIESHGRAGDVLIATLTVASLRQIGGAPALDGTLAAP